MLDNEVIVMHLHKMPAGWAFYWCESGACGCLGCANRSGQLAERGVSKEQWARCLRTMVERATAGVVLPA